MTTLVIKNPDGSQQEQDVAEQLTIGRAEGNDLILSEGGVSRKHARFFVEGAELMVEDIGSANGTWVDGEKIAGPTKLSPKSQVVIGDYEIQLKLGSKALPRASRANARPSREPTSKGPAVKPPAPRSTRVVEAIKPSGGAGLARRGGPQKAAGPQLRGLTGTVTGKTFSLSGTMTVGRVAGVDLQIDDDSVSRRHAELVIEGREVVVRDLGSANGTTVNGAPISEDTILAAGDIIQFGVVEVMFETGGSSAPRAPIARRNGAAASAPPARSSRGPRGRPDESIDFEPEPSAPPMDPGRKRLLIIGGSIVGLLFVAVLVKGLTTPPPPPPGSVPLAPGSPKTPAQKDEPDEQAQLDSLLIECRTYSNTELGLVDWARAEAACEKALDLDPLQDEANQLKKKISLLKVCEENFNQARELAAGGKLEEAVDAFAKVGRDCGNYGLRTLAEAKPTVAEVKKRAGADCKAYSSAGKWDLAYKRCELYIRLACQSMEPKELYPPALMTMKLDGRLNPKTEWRPTDTLYINFLKARDKVHPGEPMWTCPEIPAFRPPPPPPDPGKAAKEELAKRYPEAEMGRALVLYFEGKFADAPVPLQKITENMSKAAMHEEARALLLEINSAINLYENGTSELNKDRPDKAKEPFQKALVVDERLVLGARGAKLSADEKRREMSSRVSFVRRDIIDRMSNGSYQKGKDLADRKDFRAACKAWKLGLEFSRSNFDLLKALANVCTKRAADALDRAETCEQLKAALDFAVEGDGKEEEIKARLQEEQCGE